MANPIARIEEHSSERVVSFFVNCPGPEEPAWNRLRDWVTQNVSDYPARRYVGCAPKGHHPQGEGHQPGEVAVSHEYTAQMLLFEEEGRSDAFQGVDVVDAPQGLFLVGDVALDQFGEDGRLDIGLSMERSFGALSEFLRDSGGYEFELMTRPYLEEHIFSKEWFTGSGELAGFKLWLPIRKI
jgi:AraC family transcriptional regulator